MYKKILLQEKWQESYWEDHLFWSYQKQELVQMLENYHNTLPVFHSIRI